MNSDRALILIEISKMEKFSWWPYQTEEYNIAVEGGSDLQ